MKKILSIAFLVLIYMIIPGQAGAKNKKIKFGKISLEELEMTVYELDTSAPAVILYESGYYDGTNHEFIQHRRIKILKKEGYFMADSKFYTTSQGSIRGKTYNLVNGEIVESKLKNSSIYREKLWEYNYIYNVAMPDVKVGSVLDIEVKYNGFPYIWYFQWSVPVVKSECELGDSQYVTFRKQLGGILRPKEVGFNHWIAENMPAFIEEPYLSSDKNYRARVEFDLNEMNIPGYYPKKFAYSWHSVDNVLEKNSHFGKALNWPNTFLNKYVKIIDLAASSETEKAILAVETIKKLMEFNGSNRILISKDNLQDVFKEKTGSSADINLMLIALLKKLKIEVYPLVMSTRDNGMLHPVYPSLWKLNYVLAYAKLDGNFMPLDATSKLLPYNMLPKRCLNYSGRVLDGKETYKVLMIPKKKSSKRIYYDLVLDENMTLTGKVNYKDIDYAAYNFRLDFQDYLNKQEYVENLMNTNDGLTITDYQIENINDFEKPIVEKYEGEITEAVLLIDNQAYINMFLFEQINENPFKSEERKYPVDFTYARASSGTVRIKVPERFSISELPKPINISLPGNTAKFTMIYQFQNNILSLTYKLLINSVVFGEEDYANIKEFYKLVVSNESLPVIVNLNN